MKFRLSLVAPALVVGIAVMCNSYGAEGKPPVTAPKPVTLSVLNNPAGTLPIIAQQKGFFDEEGLNVKLNRARNAPIALDALLSKEANFATVPPIDIARQGLDGNQDLRVIATIFAAADSAIVARRSAGISQPKDLQGKRLGVRVGSLSEFFAEKFLAKHGLSRQDVQIQDVSGPAMLTALPQKEVDAISVWQPLVFNISRALGPEEAIVFGDTTQRGTINIAGSSAWLGDHQEESRALLRALRKAEQFVRSHPTEAQTIIAEQIGLDPETLKIVWGGTDFRLSLDAENLTREIAEQGIWLTQTQEAQKGKAVPDYRTFIDSKPFQSMGR